jgi:hypothetical protein
MTGSSSFTELIHGEVAVRFETVRTAFERCLVELDETGPLSRPSRTAVPAPTRGAAGRLPLSSE